MRQKKGVLYAGWIPAQYKTLCAICISDRTQNKTNWAGKQVLAVGSSATGQFFSKLTVNLILCLLSGHIYCDRCSFGQKCNAACCNHKANASLSLPHIHTQWSTVQTLLGYLTSLISQVSWCYLVTCWLEHSEGIPVLLVQVKSSPGSFVQFISVTIHC